MIYPSIRIEGNIISQEILSKLEEGEYPGQAAKDFSISSKAKVKDEIAFAWAMAKDYWRIFQRKLERLPNGATATSENRTDWMKPFLELLGYELELSRAEVLHEKTYAISHRDKAIGGFPVHIMGYRDSLDKKRSEGGPRMSPHGLLQDYLNISEDLYGLVSNGRYLRLLRDSGRLVKLSFAEFDLERMMEDDLYADFAILYRLLHRSRMPKAKDLGAESLIERYHQDSLDAGSRIRERLSNAVEQSILRLANGFLSHLANSVLRSAIDEKTITPELYYQYLLRLIYRFLFLMVTEERDLIFPDTIQHGREVYYDYYSLQRLRRLAEKHRYEEERFDDLWEGLKTAFRFFESEKYGKQLGILPLDGDLFGADALGKIAESRLKNNLLLECIRDLSEFTDEKGVRIHVNYGSLDVEEFGSVYEGLLEYDPVLTKNTDGWSFQFVKGDKRSSSGSHYTPEELVQPLIKHSLDYVIEEKLKAGSGIQDKEAVREAKRSALLSIKVCDIACGSGHILLSAARRIASVLAQVTTDEEQPSPTAFRLALREVIRHCIYGVDKNPLAVELCKVALWLEAHNPGMPLTFLDHRIRCGDSIVGLARREEIEIGIPIEAFKTLTGDDKVIASMFRKTNKAEIEARLAKQEILNYEVELGREIKTLVSKANELQEQKDSTVEDFHQKRLFYNEMHGADYLRLKNLADLQVAQFFTPKTPEKKDSLSTDSTYFEFLHHKPSNSENHILNATNISFEKKFFHWFLEFPEVFERGGFDCIVGNPPFLGNRHLSGNFGPSFIEWLKYEFKPIGSVDLVTYFFRRTYDLIRPKSIFALISTNTIAQGAARDGGLEYISSKGGSIIFAVKSMKWPGLAAVEISLVAVHKGSWQKMCILNTTPVNSISSYLDDMGVGREPFSLQINSSIAYQGSLVLGKGFILNKEEKEILIRLRKKNEEVILPYLNGEDLNSDCKQEADRYVIYFRDWNEDICRKEYPECFKIVETKVKEERLQKAASNNWWQFWRVRNELYGKIKKLEKTLVVARISRTLGFSFAPTNQVFADALVVIAFDSFEKFSVLQSTIHSVWAWKYCTTMKTDLNYTPTATFQTFPFPNIQQPASNNLSRVGQIYYDCRGLFMKTTQLGLTKTYNLFHNIKLTSDLIRKESKQTQAVAEQAYNKLVTLRQLHKEMDEAVLMAYGWADLDLEYGFHEVEYLPENDRVRYTISEKARKELLRRLLKLNHEIHDDEVKKGMWKGTNGKIKGKALSKKAHPSNQEGLF